MAHEAQKCVHVTETEIPFFDSLPWEDVIYRSIFRYLKVKDLFQLRGTSTIGKLCVNGYFSQMRKLLLVKIGKKFTSDTLNIITHENCFIRILIIRDANDWVNDDMLLPIIEKNLYLKHVDLSQSTTISNIVIQRLVITSGNSLKDLILRECHWLNSITLFQVSVNCPHLTKLDITGCWEIQDKAVIQIAMLCKKLQFLSVSKIYGLTDKSISEVAKNLLQLRHINLQGCWRVSDQSIFLLAEYCKHLAVVQVKDCRDVSMTCVEKLKAKGIKVDIKKLKLTPKHYTFMKALPM